MSNETEIQLHNGAVVRVYHFHDIAATGMYVEDRLHGVSIALDTEQVKTLRKALKAPKP